MKNKKEIPRKPVTAMKSLKLAKPVPPIVKATTTDRVDRSSDQNKPIKKEMGGNFSFFRDKVKDGGNVDDLRWILDLRHSKPFTGTAK